MLDDIYMQILDMTKIGSIVILVVLLARLLLKRAPKVFSYALWAVVLLRLLCPVSLEAPVSMVPAVTPVAQSYSLNDEPISVLGAGTAALEAVGDALNGGLGIQHIYTTEQDPDGTPGTVTTDWWDVWILFGQYVWVAGVAGMILYSAASYGKLRKKLAVAVPMGENIFLADDIESPFVVGLFRPKIYLPCDLGEKEQAYIIAHEQHHIRRRDHIIKALAFLALCLHWFNPLVWLAFSLSSKDMEMSCDEAVVRKMGAEIRADYAASLLTLATGRRIIAGTPLAFGEGDPKGRIRNLAKWKKPAFWVILIAVFLCVVLGVCLLTDPMTEDPGVGNTYYYGTVTAFDANLVHEEISKCRGCVTLACGDGEVVFWLAEGYEPPADILGRQVMIRGRAEDGTGLLTTSGIVESHYALSDSPDDAIISAILDFNRTDRYEDVYRCASFENLAQRRSNGSITVYGLALHQVFRLENGAPVRAGGSHTPVALTFQITDSGAYVLTEYWFPRDGAYYTEDIRAKFPFYARPDTQDHIVSQMQECYAQAVAHFGIDTAPIIAGLLDEITPVDTSFPDQYHSEENTLEYREMIYYGKYTLEYCFSEFLRGGQTDPRADIMAQVCREIMAEWDEETVSEMLRGRNWFDTFAANAQMLRERYTQEQLQKKHPAAWLYLQMNPLRSSATANGFEIKLYTDKTVYTTDDKIRIWATLEYQGEGDTVTIWHGIPYITFYITDGAGFDTGGTVQTVLTSTKLNRGEVYRFDYKKSGGYGEEDADASFWEEFYQEAALRLPAGTYTVSVNGAFSISEEQLPGEGGPSSSVQITVTE